MKRAVFVLAAAMLAACDLLAGNFRLAGTVDLDARLRARAPRQNAMLFVVAKNAGGVPVAVQRIVNPDFPAAFEMGPDEELVPSIKPGTPLTVEAVLNTRGDLGEPHPGDLVGRANAVVEPGAEGVSIVLNRAR